MGKHSTFKIDKGKTGVDGRGWFILEGRGLQGASPGAHALSFLDRNQAGCGIEQVTFGQPLFGAAGVKDINIASKEKRERGEQDTSVGALAKAYQEELRDG